MKRLIILFVVLLIAGCGSVQEPVSDTTSDQAIKNDEVVNTNPKVLLSTSMGDITIELYEDKMPITAGNFRKLVEEGFYDGLIFHRVIDGFMIQGGDPDGRGTGGPGYTIKDEFVSDPKLSNVRGTIAMANAGPNTGGSQFFINLVDNTYLDWNKPPASAKHPVFGKVVDGMDVVDAIGHTPVGAADKPVTDVVINSAKLV